MSFQSWIHNENSHIVFLPDKKWQRSKETCVMEANGGHLKSLGGGGGGGGVTPYNGLHMGSSALKGYLFQKWRYILKG